MDNKTALVTGASSGIGLELAKIHARKGDNLILVARDEKALRALKDTLMKQSKISVTVIVKDLAKLGAAADLYREVTDSGIRVDYLINNAGFGDFGLFHETDWEKEERMINLNVTALTALTKFFVKDMVAMGSGKVMNVASTAAFQPGPLMAVYYATKHFVLSFTEAIANELVGSGVTVTALCPGATASGFQNAADMKDSKLVNGKKLPSSREVAEYGYKTMMAGKTVAVHGFTNKLLATSIRFMPRKMVTNIVRSMSEKVN